MRAETENLALALVFVANRGREFSRRKECITIGKTHLIGIEVAVGKMSTTDEVIVLLNLPILDRSQHLQNLRPGGKLKKVVVVPRVATQGTPIPLEDFYFAVNGK